MDQEINLMQNMESKALDSKKVAVVLLNMGGPSSLFEVKTFLKNMFNDPYILPIKSSFLRAIIGSFIVNKRLEEAQNNYQKIGGKSPLVGHTFALCETLNALESEYYFTYVMRYTPPFADIVTHDLKEQGFNKVVLFSMYPHFSYTTTASSIDDILRAFNASRFLPEVVKVERYYQERIYNLAVLERIKEALNGENSKEFHLIFSAHSLPKKNIKNGDPYQKEILENVEILESLFREFELEFASIKVAYQSKIGPVRWLEPDLQDMLLKYKDKKLLIYPISFTMDNSETDFELSLQYKEVAYKVGIKEYRVARCLNANIDFARCILGVVKKACGI